MKKSKFISAAVLTGLMSMANLTSCVQEGCTDPFSSNYNSLATMDDGSCFDTHVFMEKEGFWTMKGDGGSYFKVIPWENPDSTAWAVLFIYNEISGGVQLTILDDFGVVLSDTLCQIPDDDFSWCTPKGQPGTWKLIVTLHGYLGDAEVEMKQRGC